ncbi:hypothetical protein ElyMa_003551300 [Elysia marginata]|uniref:Uncharacterized protein n=1 Tax=Elysia marginata TaxID=1093978 RepID=A0AAV4EK74_9GAST|nr:hypothetical protein ElyMa_003551300 [Elysia marginata]
MRPVVQKSDLGYCNSKLSSIMAAHRYTVTWWSQSCLINMRHIPTILWIWPIVIMAVSKMKEKFRDQRFESEKGLSFATEEAVRQLHKVSYVTRLDGLMHSMLE